MIYRKNLKTQSRRPGFTLVEMLVAVGLVVLMMLMFAQVFQTAGGLVSNQKGMAENDQAVRTLTILLRGDIKQRTFVDVAPFVAGQDTDNAGDRYEAEFRKGFFSISENDPNVPTDDVLHLTISTKSTLREKPQLPYSGKTRLLRTSGTPADPDEYLFNHPDQPEFDDGQIEVNDTGSSSSAEVCWFLRNGNLYRRILLIRDPYNRGSNDAEAPEEPFDSPANAMDTPEPFIDTFYDPNGDGNPDNFWRDFDYAAYWDPGEFYDPNDRGSLDPNDPNRGLKFHAASIALKNQSDDAPVPQFSGLPRSLGVPFLRYGSSISRYDGIADRDINPILGPREYLDSAAQAGFIGRFTVRETADSIGNQHPQDLVFAYPGGDFSFATDPFNENRGPALSLNNGLVRPYENDTARRGEDIVLSNVHEFDIEVWDDVMREFVDLGHDRSNAVGVPGWFHASRRFDPQGDGNPNNDFGNRFDTWHPSEFMPTAPPYTPFGDPTDLTDPTTLAQRSGSMNNGLGADGEIWLKAIRIKIRFYDQGSEQMRDLTFTFRLNRENSGD